MIRQDRLKTLFSALEKCTCFADVGCDHGVIGTEMLLSGKCERVIFSDISAPSLEKARRFASERGVADRCSFRVGDGLHVLKKGEADSVLIAGMGGREIAKILSESEYDGRLTLQPMKNQDALRCELVKMGWKILSDSCFEDGGKFYDLLVCERGEDALSLLESKYGRTNLQNPSEAFFRRLKAQKTKIKAYLKQIDPESEKGREFAASLDEIEELLK